MSRQRHRTQRLKLRSLYVWHRYMGVTVALVVLVVASTGIMLNHTEDFDFDSRYVQADWILNWYGITPPNELLTYPVEDRFITLMGDHLYLNRREIDGEYHKLVGALQYNDIFIVAVSESILLLTEQSRRSFRMNTTRRRKLAPSAPGARHRSARAQESAWNVGPR